MLQPNLATENHFYCCARCYSYWPWPYGLYLTFFSLGSVDIQQPLPRLLFWLFLASLATSFLADLMNVYVSKRTFTLGQLDFGHSLGDAGYFSS